MRVVYFLFYFILNTIYMFYFNFKTIQNLFYTNISYDDVSFVITEQNTNIYIFRDIEFVLSLLEFLTSVVYVIRIVELYFFCDYLITQYCTNIYTLLV